jgi:hypothetical protein
MKLKWSLIAVAVVIAAALALTISEYAIYIGSDRVAEKWTEVGRGEVEGEVLVCRYFSPGSGVVVSRFWPGDSGTVILVPVGGGSFVQVVPGAIGVETCPWYRSLA